MPLIKPFQTEESVGLEVMRSLPETKELPGKKKKDRFSSLLTQNGLGLEKVAENLHMLSYSENEQTRVKVAEIALKGHGVFEDEDSKPDHSIQFIFNSPSDGPINILIPRGATL